MNILKALGTSIIIVFGIAFTFSVIYFGYAAGLFLGFCGLTWALYKLYSKKKK